MNFISVKDIGEPAPIVSEVLALKQNPYKYEQLGKHKTICLLFFNPSLRTRLSTQKAAQLLGMKVMVMDISKQGWKLEFGDNIIMNQDKAEHIKEAAQVVSQYCDVLGIRTFPSLTDKNKDYNEDVLTKFINYATVPIISLESAIRHPLQSLADLVTIREHQKHSNPKVVLTWVPHPKALPQAVANSFSEWMLADKIDLTIVQPKGFELATPFTAGATISYDQATAFENADFIYAKNWSSYQDYGKRASSYANWMITSDKMNATNKAHFMHCLPVRRNVVVTDEVLDSSRSLVIQQANNRTYAAQAIIKKILQWNKTV